MSEEKKKPALDEQTLAKLLEAAYVLQEHNRELRELELGLDLKRSQIEAEEKTKSARTSEPAKPREAQPSTPADYTTTLAQIVATQHQIQIRNLDLDKALALVTERLTEIARASGAAVGVLDGKKVRYRAVAGTMTLKLGSEVPTEKALCLPCIRNAQVFRCNDVNPEFLVDTEECRRRGIQSLIAVPIFHEGVATGGLELYYSVPHGFSEQDVHTCQLMAGLVTEALARNEEHSWKESLAHERAVMLEALEKLKPNLAALADMAPNKEAPVKSPLPTSTPAPVFECWHCGNPLVAEEQYCGQCGSARGADSSMQSKVASLMRMQDGAKKEIPSDRIKKEVPSNRADVSDANSFEVPVASPSNESEFFPLPTEAFEESTASENRSAGLSNDQPPQDGMHDVVTSVEADEETQSEEVALARVPPAANWTSASSAREFLEQLVIEKRRTALGRFWDSRRGDIYLAIAVILVACVVRWGIWSNHPVNATTSSTPAAAAHHKPSPDADLSFFDRMLVSLGLAETPEVPEDKGNPNIQVWVDLHTALYYCPGTDLYGKTPKGKYTTQRDAQLDQYEPAYRKTCE